MVDQPVARSLEHLRSRLAEVVADEAASVAAAHEAAVAAARQEAAATDRRWQEQQAADRAAADARLRQELEAAAAAADTRLEAAVEAAHEAGRTATARLAPDDRLERLRAGCARLDAATSLTDVLTGTLDAAHGETGRAMIVLLQGGRPRPWRSAGMDLPADVPDAAAALVTAAAGHDPAADGTVGVLSGDAWATPLRVDGEAVAVLYVEGVRADRADHLELVARHASACLTLLTLRRTTAAVRLVARAGDSPQAEQESARRFARLLISEIKLYREADVRDGRAQRDLASRLAPEIARARQAFEVRVPAALPGRQALFEDELIRILAGGDATLLGHAG